MNQWKSTLSTYSRYVRFTDAHGNGDTWVNACHVSAVFAQPNDQAEIVLNNGGHHLHVQVKESPTEVIQRCCEEPAKK